MYNVNINITPQQITDLMITAIEGGSDYWINKINLLSHDKSKLSEKPWYASPELYEDKNIQIEFIVDNDPEKVVLTYEKIANGLSLMASEYNTHFCDFLDENQDAITADVFLQCCLFNDVIFG